ncbi:hypothetical protein CUMW_269820 [Citrus unshiu]|uniref:Fatty acyl-CoA reductase C-terminal domain-containing protein n=1 Tax=Citrus unshiu TaxID=55188 RepID=A0A2H5QX14_CITUN|nr:hypothetical protein CUMW_269820 [Citrus unshiu]
MGEMLLDHHKDNLPIIIIRPTMITSTYKEPFSVLCRRFDDICNELNRRLKLVMVLVNLYKPYMFFQGIFDDTNSEKLRRAMRESGMELDSFNFDPKSIDWEDYFLNVRIPGLLIYVVK